MAFQTKAITIFGCYLVIVASILAYIRLKNTQFP
jgi:hypothetical protein